MKRKLSLLLLIPLMILALAACGNSDDHKKGDKLKVISFFNSFKE